MQDEGFELIEVTQEDCEDYFYRCTPSTRTKSGEIVAEAGVRMAKGWTWPYRFTYAFLQSIRDPGILDAQPRYEDYRMVYLKGGRFAFLASESAKAYHRRSCQEFTPFVGNADGSMACSLRQDIASRTVKTTVPYIYHSLRVAAEAHPPF